MDSSFEPISLGPACSPKFQICRSLYVRAHPQGSVERLRAAMISGRASGIFPRHVFDSQITPPRALIAYLEHDFRGVFEREDLIVNELGVVVHRLLGSQHPHEFHAVDGRLNEAVIDAQYPLARSKFDHLAARFRRHLSEPGPFLYVRCDTPSRIDAVRIIELLSACGPDHRFGILFADTAEQIDLTDLDPRVSQGLVPPTNDKPQAIRWEGDDDGWERLFQRFDLGLPRGPVFTANFNVVENFADRVMRTLSLDWRSLPTLEPLGGTPVTVEVPETGWEYAAFSDPVEILAADRPRMLVVTVQVLKGQVGVVLTRPDGSGLIGREYWVSPEDGLIQVTLQLEPDMGPANILLRNYGHDGVPGAARVHRISLTD